MALLNPSKFLVWPLWLLWAGEFLQGWIVLKGQRQADNMGTILSNPSSLKKKTKLNVESPIL